MKIGIDCRLWNESGVGRYTRNLVKELQIIDKKNEYVLFILQKDRREILKSSKRTSLCGGGAVQDDKVKIIEANIRWHTIEEQLKLPQVINRENLDIMHFPYISVPIFYNKPYVVTIHDLILHHFPTGQASTLSLSLYNLKLLGYKFVINRAAKNAKKIITVSNATKKEIVSHLKVSEDKIAVIYEGADDKISNSKFQTSNKLQITNYKLQNSKYFLYVGNAYPHKNLERLLDAFDLFCHPEQREGSRDSSAKPQNDIRLVLVGKEDFFYKRLKEKVKNMGLEKSVEFLGEVSDEDLKNLYRNAKALILPSLMEGFGLPVLEAMANKCLILASDIPSLREICKDAAIYFDPHDVSNMMEKMKEVHSNDINHYSGNIEKGFERAKIFSWQKMAKETLKIYESSLIV